MKKFLASSVLATTVLFPVLVNAEELQLPQNVTTVQKVEVHKGATSSYPVVTSINSGTKVVIIGSFTNTAGELWYRVQYGAITGWVKSTELGDLSAITSVIPTGQNGMVIVSSASIRKGASNSYTSVKSVSKGQIVKIKGNFTNSLDELWYNVEKDGITGWMRADQVGPETSPIIPDGQYGVTVQDSTAVRKGATASYSIVKTLSKDTQVKVLGNFTNANKELWYNVEVNGVKGWVISSSLKQAALPPAPDTGLPAIGTSLYSQLAGVTVHRGAMSSYTVVGTLSLNQQVTVIDQFVNPNNAEKWLKVQVTPTLSGWVPADKLGIEQSLNLKLYVTADSANLRSGASMDNDIVGTAVKGSALTAVGKISDSTGDIWYKVIMNDGSFAYVHSSIVTEQAPVAQSMLVATRNTNLYSGASTNYKIRQKLDFLSKVTVLQEFTNSLNQVWENVKTSTGVTGWVLRNELVTSSSQIQYVYGMNHAPVRRGASSSYSVNAYLKENEKVIVLNELNGWLNVETSAGIRGWIDKSLTSNVSLKGLISPYTSTSNGAQYLNWKKPNNYNLTYSTLSGNRLRVSGGLTDIELPSFAMKGIKSVEAVPSSTSEKAAIITFEPGYTFTIRNYSDKLAIKVLPTGLAGKKIVIDAGHGGKDSGAIGPTGLYEKAVALSTALYLKTELEKYGAIVKMTRSTDIFLELSERTYISNSSDYDAFVCVHMDSAGSTARGTTTYYNSSVNFNGPKSIDMAKAIEKNVTATAGTYNRGIEAQNFYVNRMNALPSVLVEVGFISNPTEEALMKSSTFKQKAAAGIRKGLEEYFNNF